MADNNTTNSNFFALVNVDANALPRSLRNEYYLPPAAGLIGAVKQDGVTTSIASDGTISVIGGPGVGVTGLAGTTQAPFLTGNIRLLAGTNMTLVEDPIGKTITFNSSGGGGGASGYLRFTSSPTGSTGQQFSDPSLANYTSVVNITLLVNGVGLTPATSYTLSGTTITVLDYLAPSSVLQVIAKSFSGGTAYTAGNGLLLTGNTFSVQPDGASLSVSSAGVRINSTYPGQASITTVGTLTSGSLGIGFTAVGVAQGGTGASSFTANSLLKSGATSTAALTIATSVPAAGGAGDYLDSNSLISGGTY